MRAEKLERCAHCRSAAAAPLSTKRASASGPNPASPAAAGTTEGQTTALHTSSSLQRAAVVEALLLKERGAVVRVCCLGHRPRAALGARGGSPHASSRTRLHGIFTLHDCTIHRILLVTTATRPRESPAAAASKQQQQSSSSSSRSWQACPSGALQQHPLVANR